MALQFYNTMTRRKEAFAPIDASNVRLYACGPTVYDHLHIGNGRMLIVFDLLFRLLRHQFGADHVTYVRNVTDVDDKINARAAERGIGIRALTDEMTEIFHADAAALGCLPPSVEPRATDHIKEMLEIIGKLVDKGHAYAAEGHVLFDVPSMPDYGNLSKRPLDDLIAGARIEVAPYKKGPMDFVLWKPSKPDEPGWDSPWGRGRPGWHLECSAMSWRHLGEVFDIHGGGIDLVFPHHENEVAQTCCAFGHELMANVWMHNGHLQVEGEKMSKSLGNFVTIHELLHTDKFGGRAWPGEVLRLAMFRTHYRQPIDFTVKALEESEKILDRWYGLVEPAWPTISAEPRVDFIEALHDDLNTPAAISKLHSLFSSTRVGEQEIGVSELVWDVHDPRCAAIAVASAQTLGLVCQHPTEWNAQKRSVANIDESKVDALIKDRINARAAKNWAESDRIRDELAAMGITLKDNKDGTTTWEVKR
jgi:cysteinyl-tRNA synthetase